MFVINTMPPSTKSLGLPAPGEIPQASSQAKLVEALRIAGNPLIYPRF